MAIWTATKFTCSSNYSTGQDFCSSIGDFIGLMNGHSTADGFTYRGYFTLGTRNKTRGRKGNGPPGSLQRRSLFHRHDASGARPEGPPRGWPGNSGRTGSRAGTTVAILFGVCHQLLHHPHHVGQPSCDVQVNRESEPASDVC